MLAGKGWQRAAGPRWRPAARAGEARRSSAGKGLQCAIFDGECMERKRRWRGNSPETWKGGREAGRGDRLGAPAGGRCSGGGGAALAEQGGEVVRGEEETLLCLL
jgi:hypothetical protein